MSITCCPECGKSAEISNGVSVSSSGSDGKGVISTVQLTDAERMAYRNKLKDLQSDRKDALNEIMSRNEIADSIDQIIRNLNQMEIDGDADYGRPTGIPNADFVLARNKLRSSLDKLQAVLEAEWVDEQRSGKPMIKRWIGASSPRQQLEIFRRYQPDDIDETGIDVVGLIDQSGSMGGVMDHASQTMWSVASAVRLTGNAVTIVGFDDEARILIGRKQDIPSNLYFPFETLGGTDVIPGLKFADQIFDDSEMPNRLLFIVTDGDWAYPQASAEMVQEIKKDHNADTVLINLGYDSNDKRGCDHVINAHDVNEMCDSLSAVIIDISRRNAQRIAAETNREL